MKRKNKTIVARAATTLLLTLLTLLAFPTRASAWGYQDISGTGGVNRNEQCDKLFDGDTSTKWRVEYFVDAYVEFSTDEAIVPKYYVLTTGNDIKGGERNPKAWTISAKDENGVWIKLAAEDNASLPTTIQTSQVFSIDNDNDNSYQYFKFEITAIQDGDVFELSEFRFAETEPALDLSFATVVGLQTSYQYDEGNAITISDFSVKDCSGITIDSNNYTWTIKNSSGNVVQEVVGIGVYTLEISPAEDSEYRGTKTVSFQVISWTDDGGFCGNTLGNVYYKIATIDGKKTLTIRKNPYATTGDFSMKDYDNDTGEISSVFAPWIDAEWDAPYNLFSLSCDIENVVIEEGVTSIGNSAFYSCDALTSITIPNSVTSIGDNAFSDCVSLSTVTIPNSVTSIGIDTFSWCVSLSTVTIGNSVTSIGEYAFTGCSNITDVYCYANPDALDWAKCGYDFSENTKFHVYENQLVNYQTKFSNARAQFVGDIPAPKTCVITVTALNQTKTSGVHELPYTRKLSDFVPAEQAESYTITKISSVGDDNVVVGAQNGWDTSFTVTDEGTSTVFINTSRSLFSVVTITVTATRVFSVPANLANDAYWATFYSNEANFQAPEGTQVFAVNLDGTTISLTEIEDRIVNQGQGVVLKKTTEGDFVMTKTATESTGDYSTNSLTGTDIDVIGQSNAYVLGYTAAAGVGFYKLATDGAIRANRAYLTYEGTLTRDYFNFEGATAITTATNEPSAQQHHYDLMGRRVEQPTKGLYILRSSQGKNGKKVMIK